MHLKLYTVGRLPVCIYIYHKYKVFSLFSLWFKCFFFQPNASSINDFAPITLALCHNSLDLFGVESLKSLYNILMSQMV